MKSRQRLSASVDASLIDAAEAAVARGKAPTVSAWVDQAMRLKLEHDRRLDALAEFISAFEAEHGEITEDEMRAVNRRMKVRATSVRTLVKRRTAKAVRSRGRP